MPDTCRPGLASLDGIAVVVTRPAQQADALVDGLRAQGADVTAIPLLAIEPLAEASQQARISAQLQQLATCDFAIFISQNAVEQMLSALQQRCMDWPAKVAAYAIGSATAALLAGQGIAATSPARMDSEGLLALQGLQNIAGQRCLIFRGQGGRETLAQTLRDRGALVEYCELYRRTLPAMAIGAWADWIARLGNRPALICINSIETLKHLLTVDKSAAARHNLTLLVPGERVARAAADAGFARICTARDATDSSMLDTAIHGYPR
jgi:uroporphyrinogen-III synthase